MPFALGILGGLLHAWGGPDHLAGVAPLATGSGRGAWRVGLAWGLGHAAGAALVALAALVLREVIPGMGRRVSDLAEILVGPALLLVGGTALWASLHGRVPRHAHGRAPFSLGMLHGAAGLSHLFALLPALALPGWIAPLVYLAGYGIGSLAAVALFAGALGRVLEGRSERMLGLVHGLAGGASVAVGCLWLARTAL